MSDLFAEAGVSAGLFYSYFTSKEDLIVAVAEDNMAEVVARFEALAREHPTGSAGDMLADALGLIWHQHEQAGLASVAVQVWAEALTNDRLRDQLAALFNSLVDNLETALRAQQHGEVSAKGIAGALVSVIPGFLLQLAIRNHDELGDIPDAVRTLVAGLG
ncbi:Regulatory protein TetR [Nocardioides sp. PD653]|nr:Regulatory protein TetR [Nocardioides sp. PD653-B2]GAW53704.1 Regulatory protein TetR [Nocardioides sp. PD653]